MKKRSTPMNVQAVDVTKTNAGLIADVEFTVWVTTEESVFREETQDVSAEPHEGDTEHSSDATDEDWRAPVSCSDELMDTEADGPKDQNQKKAFSHRRRSGT
ncbi:hypothetical protein WMY93_011842 [Mugilogobius chulae]|uniref:Uncharacterized protein n=1 Tax=Mugilogobius chulae TaxID=88201 RepID=A0AAW0PEW6_9GOBI